MYYTDNGGKYQGMVKAEFIVMLCVLWMCVYISDILFYYSTFQLGKTQGQCAVLLPWTVTPPDFTGWRALISSVLGWESSREHTVYVEE